MKVYVKMLGSISLFAGEKECELTFDKDSVTAGEVFQALGAKYGEKFSRVTYDASKPSIKVICYVDGEHAKYNSPVPDGAHVKILKAMGGG